MLRFPRPISARIAGMDVLEHTADRLVRQIRSYKQCIVAFSGGVDSALVAKAALLALGDNAVAVTAVSPSLASGELEAAATVARQIGIQHRVIETFELSNPLYVRNAADRCFHCKTELYDLLSAMQREFPECIVANGTNTDDQADFRPGLRAAAEHQVRSPLVECGLDKAWVRRLANHWGLSVWDKPAMPCLASRVAYGQEVTPERLQMIDQAEAFLRARGFTQLRVRYHQGDLARVEVPLDELPRLLQEPLRSEWTRHLLQLGFRFVTADMGGFRSGNLNTILPLEVLSGGR